jgi:XTP/dITP diphosphohydrolase
MENLSMNTIVIATRNEKKKKEIQALLKGTRIDVKTLADFKERVPEVIENGRTFEANAAKKARQVSGHIKGFVIADDSGLVVDFLGGRPGVRSARFEGENATDEQNNAKLLKSLAGVKASKRSARFVSCVAMADNGKLIGIVEGVCRGVMLESPRGKNGFGYDPLFVPRGYKNLCLDETGF